MTVELTSPVEGKQPGDTYTGPNEAYLLAEGYAKQAGYTGIGVSNTGPARQTDLAANPEFTTTRGDIAHGSDLGNGGGTNTNVVLGPADPPLIGGTGGGGFDGFANDPAASVSSVTKADGSAANALATAGGDALVINGYGFADATGVQVGGVAGTSFTVVSDRKITVTSPAKAAGTYDVIVTRPQGNLTETGAVTYA